MFLTNLSIVGEVEFQTMRGGDHSVYAGVSGAGQTGLTRPIWEGVSDLLLKAELFFQMKI